MGDLLDVLLGQFPVGAVGHETHLAGIDEQNFPGPLIEFPAVEPIPVRAVLGEKPKADRNLGAVEQLSGHGDHAVHQVGLNKVLADIRFAAGVGGHGPVGEHETRDTMGGQMMDHVLHSSEVGITCRGLAVDPTFVISLLSTCRLQGIDPYD